MEILVSKFEFYTLATSLYHVAPKFENHFAILSRISFRGSLISIYIINAQVLKKASSFKFYIIFYHEFMVVSFEIPKFGSKASL